ncbi:hypothetical protein AB6A40_000433 [Gnathostoma spinigerum]|uniref:Secreted protein n=1 Tax=Gnathostoma spinigerum TaxID=75299 RepID=A0ABD6E235_9BILA
MWFGSITALTWMSVWQITSLLHRGCDHSFPRSHRRFSTMLVHCRLTVTYEGVKALVEWQNRNRAVDVRTRATVGERGVRVAKEHGKVGLKSRNGWHRMTD